MSGKITFPPFWFLIQKLDHNSGLHAKNQREISSNKVRRHHRPFGGGKWGKMREREGEWYKDRGKCIKKSRIECPDPIQMTLETPHRPITKFLKKCHKNVGKMRGKIIFPPHFQFLNSKLDHNSGLHAKIRKKSQVIKSEGIICPKNAGKMTGKIIFSPILVFDSKTKSQFRSTCKKLERNLQ